jgi:hypothetical protein
MRPARRSCVRGETARMCGTRHSFGGRPARRRRSPVVTGPPEGEAPVPTAAGGCEDVLLKLVDGRAIGLQKPATKARKGINPFTKEPTIFKAKRARKIIKARPVKAAKDAIL